MAEYEVVALLSQRSFHLIGYLLGREGIDLADLHRLELFERVAIVFSGSAVGVYDVACARVDQELDREVALEHLAVAFFALAQRPLGALAFGQGIEGSLTLDRI